MPPSMPSRPTETMTEGITLGKVAVMVLFPLLLVVMSLQTSVAWGLDRGDTSFLPRTVFLAAVLMATMIVAWPKRGIAHTPPYLVAYYLTYTVAVVMYGVAEPILGVTALLVVVWGVGLSRAPDPILLACFSVLVLVLFLGDYAAVDGFLDAAFGRIGKVQPSTSPVGYLSGDHSAMVLPELLAIFIGAVVFDLFRPGCAA